MTPKATQDSSSSSSSLPDNVEEKDSASFLDDATLLWAIDMDGTLIKEDVTEVAYDISLATPRYWLLAAIGSLLYYTRIFRFAAFRLWERFVYVDPALLSYHSLLLRYIRRHRQNGGKAILASASHKHATRRVANHVNRQFHHTVPWPTQQPNQKTAKTTNTDSRVLFEHVIGSDPPRTWNAAGIAKAKLIHQRLVAHKGFVYAGNSAEDLEVWQHPACRAMILVNCPEDVLLQAKQLKKPYIVLE